MPEIRVEDIYIRRCFLTGDAINVYGGRFRTDGLQKLLKMTEGAPVLIGHNKGTIPVGKFFGGEILTQEIVTIEGKNETAKFIVPKFYVMRNVSYANDIITNIDGGVISEASISWWYKKPTCSICGNDIRSVDCNHIPLQKYKGELCFYYYDELVDVAEGSLVYRGAHPGTKFALSKENDPLECKRVIIVKFRGEEFKIGVKK